MSRCLRTAGLSLVLLLVASGCGDDDDSADGDADSDADADGDADGDSDADADTVCEDVRLGCGYDTGCDGEVAPDGQCICTRTRPETTACLESADWKCDDCYSYGSVPFFCAGYPGDGWRWRRADDIGSWWACPEEDRCEERWCHGAAGDETWVCDGAQYRPEAEVDCQ